MEEKAPSLQFLFQHRLSKRLKGLLRKTAFIHEAVVEKLERYKKELEERKLAEESVKA